MKTFIRAAMCGVFFLVGISTLTAQATDPSFQLGPVMTAAAGAGNGGFAWGDVNGDGILDAYIPSNNILLNSTTAFTQSMTMTATVPSNSQTIGVALADINGDGVLDMINNNGGAAPLIYLNNAGVFTAATAVGDLANAGGMFSNFGAFAVGAIDHSGYLSIAWGGKDPGGQTGSNNNTLPNGGIWLLKGGPTGFTNVGKGTISGPPNPTIDFENRNVGDTVTSIGWPGGIVSTVALDPLGGTNKVLKNAVNNYNSAPVLKYVLPAGKNLSNYSTLTFKGYFAQGDVGYKDIIVEAYKTMPTGQFNSVASAKIGTWTRSLNGSTAWENITVSIAGSSSMTDTLYICFGIHAAGTGSIGGTGVATIWYADNVTLVPSTGGTGASLAIDTTLTYEAWDVRFFDANNDGYQDLLMPSFRANLSKIDTGLSGSRKGCVLWMNDGTGKFFIPNSTTLGRTIYALDAITAGVPHAVAKGDTGIIVDDTVRHFAAIGEQFGDLNNDGIEDLVLNGLNLNDNVDGNGNYVCDIILYGKGDGTFTYKWDGVHVVANNGLVQSNAQRSISIGDYNNDGLADIYTIQTYGPQHLYKNNGDGTFTDVATQDNLATSGARSGQFVDYNNDGFLDIFQYTGGVATLQKSAGNTNKWIGFRPVGKGNNISAIGAKFTVWTGGKKQIRVITAGGGSAGIGGDLWANFGLGTATAVDSVSVVWPDGVMQSWPGSAFTVNSYKTINEGSIIAAAPVLKGPSWTAGDTLLASNNTFKWSKVTGGTVPISYKVEVGSNKAMSTILYTYSPLSDTFKVAKVPLAVKFYWRVSALSGSFQGAYSAIDSFRTNMTPASTVPKKLSPTTNQLRLPKQPTLVCSGTPEAYIYHFQLDTLNRFAGRDTLPQGAAKYAGLLFNDSTTVTDTTKQMSALTPNRKYFWRVRGWNAAGASAWASVDSFTIMYLPTTPVLAYPGHNAANVPAVNLKMKWFRVDGDSSYVISSWTWGVGGIISRMDTTKHDSSLVMASLLNRSKYYWQVKTVNQAGESAFTAIDSFTTLIEVPPSPSAISPRNTAAEPRKTTFSWSSVAIATSYHLQVADNISFAPIKEDIILTDTTAVLKDTLTAATLYFWHVSGINIGGEGTFSATSHFTSGYGVTGVSQQIAEIPKDFALLQNYPNPFNPTTKISYDLPKASYVKLMVFDVLGRVVSNLVDGIQAANRYQVEWNPSHLSSGVYFYRIEARSQDGSANFTSVKKLLFVK